MACGLPSGSVCAFLETRDCKRCPYYVDKSDFPTDDNGEVI